MFGPFGPPLGFNGGLGPRKFPTTLVQWALDFPGVPNPTAIWSCQDAASPMVDLVSGFNLANAGAGATFQGVGDPTGRRSVVLTATNSRCQAALNTILDVSTGNITLFARTFYTSPGTPGVILEKREGNGGDDPGYSMISSTLGNIQLTVDGPGDTPQSAVVAGDQSNQFIDVMTAVDQTGAHAINVYSTGGNATQSMGGLTTLTNANFFCYGDPSGLLSRAGTYMSYAIAWLGTALTLADFQTITRGTI